MLFFSLLSACGPRHGATAPAQVDAIFEASIEAAGGRDAIGAHHNVISRGMVRSNGSQMRLTVYHAAPETLYTTLEIPGLGVISSGYSDGVAWEFNPVMGPRLLTGREAADEARRADFYASLNYTTHYPRRELKGQGVFAERPVWEVAVQTVQGDDETLYFDVETGLLRGLTSTTHTGTGAMTSTTTFVQHERYDGILLPSHMVQSMGGAEVEVTLDEVHYNVATMPSLEPPPVVRALIDEEGEDG